jgi:hypothetical protein
MNSLRTIHLMTRVLLDVYGVAETTIERAKTLRTNRPSLDTFLLTVTTKRNRGVRYAEESLAELQQSFPVFEYRVFDSDSRRRTVYAEVKVCRLPRMGDLALQSKAI